MRHWNDQHISPAATLTCPVSLLALIVIVVASIASPPAMGALGSAPEYVLDPTWRDSTDFLLTRGTISTDYIAARPLRHMAMERVLLRAAVHRDRLTAELARHLRDSLYQAGELGAKLWVEAALSPEHNPRLLPTSHAAIRYQFNEGATFYQAFSIRPRSSVDDQIRGGHTAQFRTRVWNPFDSLPSGGYVADFTRAYVRIPVAGIDITLGRQRFRWGPARAGALTLSDASPALDGVSVSGAFGPVLGTAVVATLNRMWHDDGETRYLARRYLSAHRLHWQVSDRLEVAIMDTVLYGGDGRQVDPYYANPVLPFYASQFNATSAGNAGRLDDNAMIGADVRWNPAIGWSLYAEGLVDDFAYDPDSDDPNALAWTVGAHRAGLWDRAEARVEYTRVGRYTYTHLRQENQYTHFGAGLGHPLGNDVDVLAAEAAWWLAPASRLAVRIAQTRKGDSGVGDRYRGEGDTAFLAGAATTTRVATVSGWRRFWIGWLATGSVSFADIRNVEHIMGATGQRWEWRASIGRGVTIDS